MQMQQKDRQMSSHSRAVERVTHLTGHDAGQGLLTYSPNGKTAEALSSLVGKGEGREGPPCRLVYGNLEKARAEEHVQSSAEKKARPQPFRLLSGGVPCSSRRLYYVSPGRLPSR
jgi:hypothetical protein